MVRKMIIVFLVATGLFISLAGCYQAPVEIHDSKDALPVTEPNESALPKEVLAPGFSYSEEELQALPKEAITWGPGVQKDDKGIPIACLQLQDQYGKYDALFLGPEDGKIYLTFDEGYENGYTADILDTLQNKGVTAVFFITLDYAEREPELVKRMIAEGHVVGNHTANHPNMTKISIEKGREEVQELQEYMLQNFDYAMTLFRAPEGAISEQSMALLQSLGYQSVLWSFAYFDWDVNQQMDEQKALEKLCENHHPGAIYLLHAVSRTNAHVLGDFIDRMRQAGYEFGSLEESIW